ncbi:MAG: hypothetical protein ACLP5E_02990 [Streptosporangiaceae bacterium]
MGGISPGLLDVAQWHGASVDVQLPVGDLPRECGQFGEDFPGADGPLPAADNLEAGGTERG